LGIEKQQRKAPVPVWGEETAPCRVREQPGGEGSAGTEHGSVLPPPGENRASFLVKLKL